MYNIKEKLFLHESVFLLCVCINSHTYCVEKKTQNENTKNILCVCVIVKVDELGSRLETIQFFVFFLNFFLDSSTNKKKYSKAILFFFSISAWFLFKIKLNHTPMAYNCEYFIFYYCKFVVVVVVVMM